jgi:hypothetical protein
VQFSQCLKLLGGPRHPHPLEQFIVVGWIGVSPHRFPPPSSKGCSSGRHILFILFMVLSRSYSLYSGYFIPLYLCDFSISCIRTSNDGNPLVDGGLTGVQVCRVPGRMQAGQKAPSDQQVAHVAYDSTLSSTPACDSTLSSKIFVGAMCIGV